MPPARPRIQVVEEDDEPRATPAAAASATATTAAAFSTSPAPVLPVLTTAARAQTLQVILELYTTELGLLNHRIARVEQALLTKGTAMKMEAQATDFEAQDAARHTLASGAVGQAVDDAAAVPLDGWRCVFALAPLSTFR